MLSRTLVRSENEHGHMYGDMHLWEPLLKIKRKSWLCSAFSTITAQPAHTEIYAGLSTKILSEHIAKIYTHTLKILSCHHIIPWDIRPQIPSLWILQGSA